MEGEVHGGGEAFAAASAARGVVVAVMGLPGAGKSSLVGTLGEVWRGGDGPLAVRHIEYDVALDAALDDLAGAWASTANSLTSFEEAWCLSRSESLAQVARGVAEEGSLVVVDDNAYYASMRHDLYKVARDAGYCFAVVYLDVPVAEALRRNALRRGRRFVNPGVIEKMASHMEPPDGAKRPWERHAVTVVPSNKGPQQSAFASEDDSERFRAAVDAIVRAALRAGPAPRPRDVEAWAAQARLETTQSEAHGFDLRLRVLVGDVIKAAPPAHKRTLAALLAAARKARPATLAAFRDAVLLDLEKKVPNLPADERARIASLFPDR